MFHFISYLHTKAEHYKGGFIEVGLVLDYLGLPTKMTTECSNFVYFALMHIQFYFNFI